VIPEEARYHDLTVLTRLTQRPSESKCKLLEQALMSRLYEQLTVADPETFRDQATVRRGLLSRMTENL